MFRVSKTYVIHIRYLPTHVQSSYHKNKVSRTFTRDVVGPCTVPRTRVYVVTSGKIVAEIADDRTRLIVQLTVTGTLCVVVYLTLGRCYRWACDHCQSGSYSKVSCLVNINLLLLGPLCRIQLTMHNDVQLLTTLQSSKTSLIRKQSKPTCCNCTECDMIM